MISIIGALLLFPLFGSLPLLLFVDFECVGAPFNAELLANCKYADSFGKMSLTSSTSFLRKDFQRKRVERDQIKINYFDYFVDPFSSWLFVGA